MDFHGRGGFMGRGRGGHRGRGRGGGGHRGHGRGRGGHRGRGRGRGIQKKGHHENFSKDKQETILNYLKHEHRDPQSAIVIARKCGYQTARDVNPTLYSLHRRQILIQEDGRPPLWSLSPNFAENENQTTDTGTTQMLSDMSSMGLGDSNLFGTGNSGNSASSSMGIGVTTQMNLFGTENRMQTNFGIGNIPQTSTLGLGDNSQTNFSDNAEMFSQSMLADGTIEPTADVKVESSEEGIEEDAEEEMEEDEEFDINDRINDLMAFTGSNALDINAPSPGRIDSQEDEVLDLWAPIPTTDITQHSEVNIQPKLEAKDSGEIAMIDEKVEEPQSLDFKDKVLKVLAQRILKTGASFVIVNTLRSNKEDVEKVLRECEQEKLVSLSGTAWTITKKGDDYLEEKKICGPSVEIVANVRRGDQNIYHPSKRGFGRGVPMNPLELMSSNTKFGVTGTGRGEKLREITEDIKKVTNPEIHQNQINLANLSSDSVIRRLGRGQTIPSDLVTKVGIHANPPIHVQSGGLPFNTPSTSLNMTQSFGQNQVVGSFTQRPQGQIVGPRSMSSSIPMSPLELIQRERMSPQSFNQPPISPNMCVSLSGRSLPVQPQSDISMTSQSLSPMMGMPSSGQRSLPVQPQSDIPMTSSSFSSLPAGSLQITAETFAGVNKNPVSALMEYAQSRATTARIEVISSRGPSHRPKFVIAAFVGNRQFPAVECGNKKDGKKEAADVAMRILLAEGQKNGGMSKSEKPLVPAASMTHFDKMAALTHQAFNQLIASIPEAMSGRKIIAGLVMKRNSEDLGIVISVGSGNRCITGQQLSLEGTTVNDCHAEIITRRGFIRFLYRQLETYVPGHPHDLFEPGRTGKLQIKPGITFHLYISTAPCGDGALFSPRDAESNKGPSSLDRQHQPTFTNAVQGLLRTKMEGGEGTIPIESDFIAQTFDGIQRGERLRTMSCTDKICRWNVVGMQGALLSHFLEPIYLDSLTLGFLYDHGHLARAVCCRVDKTPPPIDTQLPSGFRLNHPWLGRVTACDPPRETQKTKSLSVNWSLGDQRPEVLDGPLGLCYTPTEKTFFSRLTKKNLYESFKTIATKFGRQDLLGADTYNKAKMMAADFQTAKAAMLKKMKESKFGPWVSKPVEEEMFS